MSLSAKILVAAAGVAAVVTPSTRPWRRLSSAGASIQRVRGRRVPVRGRATGRLRRGTGPPVFRLGVRRQEFGVHAGGGLLLTTGNAEVLRHRPRDLMMMFRHAPDAILLLDLAADRVVEANAAASRLLGYSEAELLRTPISRMYLGDRRRVLRSAESSGSGESGWTDELSCVTKSADRVPVEISSWPTRVGGRNLVLAILRDISERKRLEAERDRLLASERAGRKQAEQRQALLERVGESRGRLIRGFTHDVKNPLGAADGRLQLLRDGLSGPVSADQREAIEKVRRSIRRGLDLIDDLLEVGRAESGNLEVASGAVDLMPLLTDLVDEHRGRAERQRLAIAVEEGRDLPLVQSDPRRVRQVLANLLSNAIKYTPDGGQLDVRADCCDRDGSGPGEWVCVTISDDGPGIPTERQGLLFREFSRLDPDAAEGAGVGLAISHQIAAALGGELTVQSEPGVGSAFTLWLPTCLHLERLTGA
jgi:PAS domain S-box-containing protein